MIANVLERIDCVMIPFAFSLTSSDTWMDDTTLAIRSGSILDKLINPCNAINTPTIKRIFRFCKIPG